MKPAAERLRERLATTPIGAPVHPGDRQHRRQERERAARDPRRALSPGVRPGALGRDDPGDPGARRRPHLRVRPGQACSPAWSSGSSPTRSRPRSSIRPRSPKRRGCCDERPQLAPCSRSRSSPARRAASAGRSRQRSPSAGFGSSARRRPKPARRRSARRSLRHPACRGIVLDVTDAAAVSAVVDAIVQRRRRPARARQQRRHHARHAVDADEGRGLGRRARDQPEGRLPRQPRGDPADDEAALRADRQHHVAWSARAATPARPTTPPPRRASPA